MFNKLLMTAIIAVSSFAGAQEANATETYVSSKVSKVEVVDHTVVKDGEVISSSRFLVEPQPDGTTKLIPFGSGVQGSGDKLGNSPGEEQEPVPEVNEPAEVNEDKVESKPVPVAPVVSAPVAKEETPEPVVAKPVERIEAAEEQPKDTGFRKQHLVSGGGDNRSGDAVADSSASSTESHAGTVKEESATSSVSGRSSGSSSPTSDAPMIEESNHAADSKSGEEESSMWSAFSSKLKAGTAWMAEKIEQIKDKSNASEPDAVEQPKEGAAPDADNKEDAVVKQ